MAKIGKYLFFIVNFAFSVFLYGNVIEKAFVVDLPYFTSISSTSYPVHVLASEDYVFKNQNADDVLGFFGRPQTIRVPRLGFALDLETPKYKDDQWMVSNTKTYVLPYSTSKSGLLANTLVFSTENFIQMDSLMLATEGDRITLETDRGWIYTYRITKKRLYKSNESPILDKETPSKVVISKEIYNGDQLIIEAEYVNVQEATV